MEDIPCDYSDWIDTEAENKWASRTLKIWFFTLKNFSIIHKWAKWPDIIFTTDEAFFSKASKEIEDEVEELD